MQIYPSVPEKNNLSFLGKFPLHLQDLDQDFNHGIKSSCPMQDVSWDHTPSPPLVQGTTRWLLQASLEQTPTRHFAIGAGIAGRHSLMQIPVVP